MVAKIIAKNLLFIHKPTDYTAVVLECCLISGEETVLCGIWCRHLA